MKISAALSVLALALSACSQGTAVEVTVDSAQTITLDHLAVHASVGAATRDFTVPLKAKMLPPAQTFVLDVGDKYSGTVTISIDAASASGDVLTHGSGSAELAHGKTVELTVTLDGNLFIDGGTTDGEAGDLPLTDMALPCGTTTTACSSAILSTTCGTSGTVTTETCPLGCVSPEPDADMGVPHCAQVVPTLPIKTNDVYASDVTANTTLPAGTVIFNTATGSIVTSTATIVRAENPSESPTRSVDPTSGIAFSVMQIDIQRSMGVWSFKKLTIPASTTVYFVGGNAVGLAVAGDVSIAGNVNLFSYDPLNMIVCPQMTQPPGGEVDSNGQFQNEWPGQAGTGNSADTYNSSQQIIGVYHGGGGGGGYGAPGGAGGYTPATNPGSGAGASYGFANLSPIIGGSAGGWAADETHTVSGAGGGAIQVVSGSSITVSGVINAGGCGGRRSTDLTGPGGGGSGGAILLETPTLAATSTGVLAVNGGGGGAGGCSTDGQNGQPSATAATGGPCQPANGSPGGVGGTNGAPTGGSGSQQAVGMITYGSGGGGGVGRMRFNVVSSPTLSTAVVSPAPTSVYTTQGALATQ